MEVLVSASGMTPESYFKKWHDKRMPTQLNWVALATVLINLCLCPWLLYSKGETLDKYIEAMDERDQWMRIAKEAMKKHHDDIQDLGNLCREVLEYKDSNGEDYEIEFRPQESDPGAEMVAIEIKRPGAIMEEAKRAYTDSSVVVAFVLRKAM
jgi:hypothetical protein